MLSCKIGKHVAIVNTRLSMVFWILWVAIFIASVVDVVRNRTYNIKIDISSRIFPQEWIINGGYDELRASVANLFDTSDFCNAPGLYDYWMDEDGVSAYENFTCREMCPDTQVHPTCIPAAETGSVSLAGDIFIVTSAQDKVSRFDAHQDELWHSANYWVMSSEFISIGFTYTYEPEDSSVGTLGELGEAFYSPGVRRSSASEFADQGLTTVVLDSEGRFWKAEPPGDVISMTVKEILVLLGQETLLADPNIFGVPNHLKRDGVSPGKPPVRLTGAWIDLELGCYTQRNPLLEGVELPEWVRALKPEEICTLRARRIPVSWIGMQYRIDDIGNGTVLHRSYHGLKVTMTSKGVDEHVDLNSIVLTLITFTILLSYPTKIITFLALNCFGHLSKVYRRVLVQEFNINQHLAGAATRLSTMYPIFENVAPGAGIDFESMSRIFQKRLGDLLKDCGMLDDDEINAMVQFSLHELRHVRRAGQYDTILGSMARQVGMEDYAATPSLSRILSSNLSTASSTFSPQQLSSACWVDSAIDARDLAYFFDKDRKVWIGERLFTPAQLWKAVHKAHQRSGGSPGQAQDMGPPGISGTPDASSTSGDMDLCGNDNEDATRTESKLSMAQLEKRLTKSELHLADFERRMVEWKEVAVCTMSTIEARVQELELRSGKCIEVLGRPEDAQQASGTTKYNPEDAQRDTLSTPNVLTELKESMVAFEQRLANALLDLETRMSNLEAMRALDTVAVRSQIRGWTPASPGHTSAKRRSKSLRDDVERQGPEAGVQIEPGRTRPGLVSLFAESVVGIARQGREMDGESKRGDERNVLHDQTSAKALEHEDAA